MNKIEELKKKIQGELDKLYATFVELIREMLTSSNYIKDWKVIGNIFENEELLK